MGRKDGDEGEMEGRDPAEEGLAEKKRKKAQKQRSRRKGLMD
jgi:hypothetical protein